MANTNQPKGTGFVNLSRYLGANKNNNLGSAVSSNVSGRAGEVKSNLGQLQSNFAQGAEKNALGTNANVEARTKALESIMGGNTSLTPQTEQDFAKFRTGAYAGPTELDPTKTSQVAAKAGQLERDVKGLGTAEGRGNLLRATVGKPNYSQGQQKLDNLLLAQQPNELNRTRRDVSGLGRNVQEAKQSAEQIGKTQVARAQEFGNETKRILQNNTDGIVSALDAQAIQANNEKATKYNEFLDAVRSGNVTPEQAQLLGMKEGDRTFRTDFSPFIQKSDVVADRSNIAGEIDKAKLTALAKLSGLEGVNAINTQAQAYNPIAVKQADLANQIASRQQKYNDILNKLAYEGDFSGEIDNKTYTANQDYQGRRVGESAESYLDRVTGRAVPIGGPANAKTVGGIGAQLRENAQKFGGIHQQRLDAYNKILDDAYGGKLE